MKNSIRFIAPILLIVLAVAACVPKRQLDDMTAKYNAEKSKAQDLHQKNLALEAANADMTAKIEEMTKAIAKLKEDTAICGRDYRRLSFSCDRVENEYRELLELQDRIKKGNEQEARKYAQEIERTKTDLQAKEDKLNEIQKTLAEKEASLNKLSQELEASKQELAAREAKVAELQSIINRQDSASRALKAKIQAALLGLENNGLTIEMKNGKVYVSLDNELLFKPGSYVVDKKGKDALKKLAEVLNQNPDINIAVEGHTDSDAYRGKGELEDNWDLSVKRATSIVKILVGFQVDPKRITASGRGEHQPLDAADTPEAKKKNRRTEIILTPNLDEILNIIGN